MARQPTFADRFGYARWLLLLGRDELPGFAEIGRAVGRTGQAVSAWTSADEAPPGPLEFYDQLADTLGVDMRWLIKGEGDAPEPALWAIWCDYRGRRAREATRGATASDADLRRSEADLAQAILASPKPAAKPRRAAGAKRKR